MENFSTRDGQVLSSSLNTYLIPTALDIPIEMDCVLVENPDPNGPFSARGVGEIPFIPLAPATLAAIQNATGAWFNFIPLPLSIYL